MVRAPHSSAHRRFHRLRFWAFALLGLVIGHDAVFVAEHGPSSATALAATGHGYWYAFAALALLLAGIPIVAGLLGLARLRARIVLVRRGCPQRRAERDRRNPAPAYVDEFLGLAPRLFAVIVIGFLVQENLEHLAAGHGLHGLAVLVWSDHPLALPVLFGVSILLGLAAAWLRWRGAVLEHRLAAARAGADRLAPAGAARAASSWRDVAALVAHGWLVARRLAGRAPPIPAGAWIRRSRGVAPQCSTLAMRGSAITERSPIDRRHAALLATQADDPWSERPTGDHRMHAFNFRRLAAAASVALVIAALATGVAQAHVLQDFGPYSVALGWVHEPTYVGEVNAVQVVVKDANGSPVTDLAAGDLKVVVSVAGQATDPLDLVPMYDGDTGLGVKGDYEASLIPTAPGDYTFHLTGSIHGTAIDETATSSDSTFNAANDPAVVQFPVKLPSLTEAMTRLDRLDARIAAVASAAPQAAVSPPAMTMTETTEAVAVAQASASQARDAAATALVVGLAVGGLGVVLGATALFLSTRRRPSVGT